MASHRTCRSCCKKRAAARPLAVPIFEKKHTLRSVRECPECCPLFGRPESPHHIAGLEGDLRSRVWQHVVPTDYRHDGGARLAPDLQLAYGFSNHPATLR